MKLTKKQKLLAFDLYELLLQEIALPDLSRAQSYTVEELRKWLFEKTETKMNTQLCAIYDKKTKIFENPFACRHVGEALRDWDNLKKNQETRFAKNPEDFDLYKVGEYDINTGELIHQKPTHIG